MFLYKKEMDGVFYSGTKILNFEDHDIIFYSENSLTKELYNKYPAKHFSSNEEKVFVRFRPEFFHAFADTFNIVLTHHKKNPETLFILNLEKGPRMLFDNTFIPFILKTFKKLNIKFEAVYVQPKNAYKIDNFFYYPLYPLNIELIKNIDNVFAEYFSSEEPYKKVYLSRKKVVQTRVPIRLFGNIEEEKFLFKDDIRMADENTIEKYMLSVGFEVVYPEDFESMEEQINFMSKVKTMAAPSGSGLLNISFMKPGTKVLEFTTPISLNGEQNTHNLYHGIAFAKSQKYMSISNFRDTDKIIDIIEQDSKLKEWILD
jgi:hypothetical protein